LLEPRSTSTGVGPSAQRPPSIASSPISRIAGTPHPTPDDYIERARLLAVCGEPILDRAVKGLDEGIARLGPMVSLEFYAIDLECQQGRFDSALKRLDVVAPQFDRKENLLERRGEILTAAGRVAEAREAFAAALAAIDSRPTERRGGRAARAMEARLRAALEAQP